MVEYPTDLAINDEKDIYLDDGNDLALVNGVQQLRQSVGIDVMDELQAFIGGRITGTTIGRLEERIRRGLDDDPQLAGVRDVTIQEYDRGEETVLITAEVVGDDDFTIEVST